MRKLISIVFVVMITSLISFAQNTVEEFQPQDLIQVVGLDNIGTTYSINPTQIENIPNQSNSIFINQIGAHNRITVRTRTQKSNINIDQNGDYNSLKLNFSALSASETILQQGDNHFLATYGKSATSILERTINQSGYGQKLTIHGSNSISEKMQLNMKGASSTIIIRNFN